MVIAVSVAPRSHAETPAAATVWSAPARAVDVFGDDFLIEKPQALVELPAAAEVWADGFEADSLDPEWRWLGTPGTTVGVSAERAHGGRRSLAFAAAAPALMPSLERVVAVRPETTYLLSAYLFTEALEPIDDYGVGASLELHELRQPHDRGAAGTLVAHQHLPRERGTSADWRKLDYRFRTSEMTSYVRIVIEAATGRSSGRVWVDDLKLAEIPRIVEHLESDGFVSATRQRASHPLVKRIRVTGNDYRPAILAPAPTRWRWSIRAAGDTLLRFETGLLPVNGGPSKVCFRLRWHEPGGAPGAKATEPAAGSREPPGVENVLFDDCIEHAAARAARKWQPAAVDLAPWAGRELELFFETSGSAGAPALWGNPRLVARERAPGDDRPNIVLLVVDTLRADHLGIEGYGRPTSPALDRLARSSVRYTRAYSSSPWTAPSMASLMTGRYPSQHHGGIRIEREQRHRPPARRRTEDEGPSGWENRLLGDLFRRATTLQYHAVGTDNPTLAERLRAAGYATFGFHSNFNSSGAIGLSRGFDRYEMFSGVSSGGAEVGVSLARSVLSDRRRKGEKGPFLLMFHTQDPHIPYRLRRSLFETFGPAPENLPVGADGVFRPVGRWAVEFWDWGRLRSGGARNVLDHVIDFYDSEIAWADQAIGKLLEDLDEMPGTVVVLTADHGEEFGDHGQFEHGHSLYDELLRVPLFVRLPGARHAGSVVREPVATVDVAPTLLHLAGAAPLPAAEGRPLFATGAEERRRPRDGIIAEAMLRGPERTAVVAGSYKYILTHALGYLRPFPTEDNLVGGLGLTANLGHEELYDLGKDPGEERDLAQREPEVTGRLRAVVRSYLREASHGLHVRCKATSIELELASTATFAHLQPVSVEAADSFEVDASRRRLKFGSEADESEDWWILRSLEAGAQLVFRASSDDGRIRYFVGGRVEPAAERSLTVRLGDETLVRPAAAEPPRTDGPWCQVWQVPGGAPASSEALDSEIVDQLRALGYLG